MAAPFRFETLLSLYRWPQVQILPGNVHESSAGFCMIHFRTASQVPASGSVYVEVPAEFDADCSGGLYDAQTNELGGDAVAQGTPCVVQRAELPGQPHGFVLGLACPKSLRQLFGHKGRQLVFATGPLTSPLSSNAAYLLLVPEFEDWLHGALKPLEPSSLEYLSFFWLTLKAPKPL